MDQVIPQRVALSGRGIRKGWTIEGNRNCKKWLLMTQQEVGKSQNESELHKFLPCNTVAPRHRIKPSVLRGAERSVRLVPCSVAKSEV